MNRIQAIICKPLKNASIETIPNTLETYQRIVEGYIEVRSLESGIDLIVNEEGLINGQQPCRVILDKHGRLDFVAYGPIIIVGRDPESGEFKGLTDEQAGSLAHRFLWAEEMSAEDGMLNVERFDSDLVEA